MSDQDFAKVDSAEIQAEFHKAHDALNEALGRQAGDLDLEEIEAATKAVLVASGALRRRHRPSPPPRR